MVVPKAHLPSESWQGYFPSAQHLYKRLQQSIVTVSQDLLCVSCLFVIAVDGHFLFSVFDW